MSGRRLPPGTYGLDDLVVGDAIETAETTVSEALIDQFADMTGDRFGIHMDDEVARALGFARRVAHGLLILSLTDGLKNQAAAQFRAIASLHWDWSFRHPVLAGDSIRARIEVRALRPTSDGTRGIIELAVTVHNQRGEAVQMGTNLLMVQR